VDGNRKKCGSAAHRYPVHRGQVFRHRRSAVLFSPPVSLAPDVAAAFPDSEAVNETLRFLMRITEKEVARRP